MWDPPLTDTGTVWMCVWGNVTDDEHWAGGAPVLGIDEVWAAVAPPVRMHASVLHTLPRRDQPALHPSTRPAYLKDLQRHFGRSAVPGPTYISCPRRQFCAFREVKRFRILHALPLIIRSTRARQAQYRLGSLGTEFHLA